MFSNTRHREEADMTFVVLSLPYSHAGPSKHDHITDMAPKAEAWHSAELLAGSSWSRIPPLVLHAVPVTDLSSILCHSPFWE